MFPYNRPSRRHPFRYYRPYHEPPFLQQFKTKEGFWDFEKIYKSINDINKIIGEVNPIIQQISKINKVFKK